MVHLDLTFLMISIMSDMKYIFETRFACILFGGCYFWSHNENGLNHVTLNLRKEVQDRSKVSVSLYDFPDLTGTVTSMLIFGALF